MVRLGLQKNYNGKDYFSVKIPKQWEIKEKFKEVTVSAFPPGTSSSDKIRDNVCINVIRFPVALNVTECLKIFESKYQKIGEGFQEIAKGDTTIADEDAKWITFIERIGTIDFKSKIYLVVRDKRFYLIKYTTKTNDFSKYSNIFEAIVLSFEFE